jgi:Rieske Fe-S protein
MEPKTSEKEQAGPRRKFLQFLFGIAGFSLFASIASLIKGLIPPKGSSAGYIPTVQVGDKLVYAMGDKKNKPVLISELSSGEGVLVYPQKGTNNEANLIILVKEDPEDLQEPTVLKWTDQGLVAYSALCTHLSCTVSWKQAEVPKAGHIHCYCHDSIFDPKRGAKVLGGPAPRPLPQIPIKVNDNGEVIVTGPFEEAVGPVSV